MQIINLQYYIQVGEVCRNVTNDVITLNFADNMDIVGRISHDLENEGVQLSNNKILKILQALKNIVKAYYRAYVKLTNAPVAEG